MSILDSDTPTPLKVLWGWLDENKRWHHAPRVPMTARQQHEQNLANGFNFVPADSLLHDTTDVLGYVHVDGMRFSPRGIFEAWAQLRATPEERAQWRPVGYL